VFLHQRDLRFQVSVGVEAVAGYLRAEHAYIANDPADKITAYLGFLEDSEYVNDGILTGNQASIHHQVEARVIAAEDIPESYLAHRQRVGARGQGQYMTPLTPQARQRIIEGVQADQRESLKRWAAHFGNSVEYPVWFKHYVWEAIGSMGLYDKARDEFHTRSRSTAAPYPELNKEALAYVYKNLDHARIQQDHVEDDQLRALLENGNFNKLYAHAIREVTAETMARRKVIDGSWKTFPRSSIDGIARLLSNSMQGYGTGWCVVGGSVARERLEDGAIYVYRTKDREGKDTIPRVAVRMEGARIAEVRGVNGDQDVEAAMADIAIERIRGLPGWEIYADKAEDVKQLAAIEQRVGMDNNVQLPPDDIRFLYEIDREIEGFGQGRDSRIAALKRLRGDRDRAEVARILPEAIRGQLASAYNAYESLMGDLTPGNEVTYRHREAHKSMLHRMIGAREATPASTATVSADEAARLFAAAEAAWREDGTFDYLVEQVMGKSTGFTLVVTPSAVVDMDQLLKWAAHLGTDAQHTDGLTDFGKVHVAPSLVSGFDRFGSVTGNNSVRFSIIPTASDDEFKHEAAAGMARILRARQDKYPGVPIRVPDYVDAVAYWRCYLAKGKNLDGEDAHRKTAITHFRPQTEQLGSRMTRLLRISEVRNGIPVFDYQEDGREMTVRLAIG
jgi:hypothetical protein